MFGHVKRLKNHYQKLHFRHKAILTGLFIIGSMTSLFSSLFASNLPFQSNLPTLFGAMGFSTGNFSEAHFTYGGNNFAGVIFWLNPEILSSPEIISVNGGSQSISCLTKLQGLYYNNMRGWRLRPLDNNSLSILSGQGSGYETMLMSGGLYTQCTGITNYNPLIHGIYGAISHTRSGTTMHMIAGVDYDFAANTLSPGSAFSDSLLITGGTYSGWLWDNYGGIARISSGSAPLLDTIAMCDGFSLTPISITTGNTINFTCSGHSITGYTLTGYVLHIFSGVQAVYTSTVYTSSNSYTRTTASSLPVGNYTTMCVILHNNGVGPQCGSNPNFSVTANGSGCLSNIQGDVTPANVYHFGGIMYYTSSSGQILQISATNPVSYLVTGNFISPPITGIYTGSSFANPISVNVYLTNNNNRNYIYSTYITGSCIYTGAQKQIYRDTLPPTTPTLSSPLVTTGICSTGAALFSWTASIDSGGMASYRYILQHASGTLYSGTVSAPTTGAYIMTQNMFLGNYSRYVQAIDIVGNIATSTTGAFSISPDFCSSSVYGSGIQIIGSLSSVLNANLDTLYTSELFYVRGLTGPTLISINQGTLIINGTGISTTGMITANTPLRIELISSPMYDTTVTSLLSVAGITGSFSVTTKDNICNLSQSQKEAIEEVYQLIKDKYANDTNALYTFLAIFQKILGDEVDITEDCSLAYLLELINEDYNDEIDITNHIAPNCKEYQISYDQAEDAYYSPMMQNRYYFVNRETLIRHIDFYNAGDCHINTYGNVSWVNNRNSATIHVAPNGKIYHIQAMGDGYTSSDFVGNKYFDNLMTMRSYINSKNPVTNVWNHTVDTTFLPLTYVAPNAKEYRIYKTNRGFMSYKLMKVQYFEVLAALQDYINRNNPPKK